MMKIKIVLVPILIWVSLLDFQAQNSKNYLIRTIGFYNVENLFDYEKDLKIWDVDWTPEGKNRWTKEKYLNKLEKLARVISEIGTDLTQTTPDLIGLAEIENRRVLEDLINQPSLISSNYGIIHQDGKDKRGIEVALIYKKSSFTPTSYKSFPLVLADPKIPEKQFFSRDQLLVVGLLDQEEIHLIVNHWPSRYGGEKHSRTQRIEAAKLTRIISDSVLFHNPQAKLIIMGDFNDNPKDISIKNHLQTKALKAEVKPNEFFNPMEKMFQNGLGSLAYQDSWSLFDQILVSHELSVKEDFSSFRFFKAGIFNKIHLQISRGKYKGYPFRTFLNGNYTGGYSDHFPVYIYLVREVYR